MNELERLEKAVDDAEAACDTANQALASYRNDMVFIISYGKTEGEE
tara:strand:- start:819 stop:956 length:138 start_codon:yes stop_codon:yes gene_type:complete